jgi:hypothetical protein
MNRCQLGGSRMAPSTRRGGNGQQRYIQFLAPRIEPESSCHPVPEPSKSSHLSRAAHQPFSPPQLTPPWSPPSARLSPKEDQIHIHAPSISSHFQLAALQRHNNGACHHVNGITAVHHLASWATPVSTNLSATCVLLQGSVSGCFCADAESACYKRCSSHEAKQGPLGSLASGLREKTRNT